MLEPLRVLLVHRSEICGARQEHADLNDGNVDGDWFVDTRCIDGDTAYLIYERRD